MIRRAYSKMREENFEVIIDWNLGNSCSFKCSYCHPHFHAGNNAFPDLTKAKTFVDRIADKHQGSNRAVRFSFVGGEPTEYPDLLALCEHIRSHGFSAEIKTNCSMSMADWEKFAPHLSFVVMTYHEGKLDFGHLCDVVAMLKSNFVDSYVVFAARPDAFDTVLGKLNAYKARFPGAMTEFQLLYKDHVRRSALFDYTPEQIEQWRATLPQEQWQDYVFENQDGTTEVFGFADDVIFKKRNQFTGMTCNVGADLIVVDQDGSIRRGWCRTGGLLGNIHDDDFVKPTDSVVCGRPSCNNPLDLSVMKYREE